MDEKDRATRRYSSSDAASLALASSIAALAGRVEEVVKFQQTLAKELADHSAKSAAAQAMLLNEIEKAKSDHLLRTGDQSKAIEILRIEREAIDNELRKEIDYYKRQQPALLQRLEKISTRLEAGSLKIDKGVRAWEILKWAGIIVGGAILLALVSKVIVTDRPLTLGALRITPEDIGPVSALMSAMGSAWLLLSALAVGVVQAIVSVRHHFGS